MSIRFNCPVCGYHIKAPDGTFGRRGHCPRCKVMIRVPKEDELDEQRQHDSDQTASTFPDRMKDSG